MIESTVAWFCPSIAPPSKLLYGSVPASVKTSDALLATRTMRIASSDS